MYHKITNPATNRKVSVYGKIGQRILRNYINVMNGGRQASPSNSIPAHCKNEGEDSNLCTNARQSLERKWGLGAWQGHEDADGTLFYHNRETGVTQWDEPEEWEEQQAASTAANAAFTDATYRAEARGLLDNARHGCCVEHGDPWGEKPLIDGLSQLLGSEDDGSVGGML